MTGKYQLEQAVMSLKQGQLDLSTYFTQKKTLWEKLANTKSSKVKKCNCDHVKELLEEAATSQIIQFLMGLNDNFNNIRGQILNMKPHSALNDIYNMLDQDESQRMIGNHTKGTPNPTAFQMQFTQSENSQALLAHGGFQKPKCSHRHRIGHTVEKCYKVHGYPPGHPQRNKENKQIGSTNLAATYALDTSAKEDKEANEGIRKEHIQSMISYLSSQLQNATSKPELLSLNLQTPSSTSAKNFASSSTSVPSTSQITGTFLTFKTSIGDVLKFIYL